MTEKLKQKWVILAVYTLGSFWNGFTFSNFGGDVDVIKDAYNINIQQLNLIYSVIFITVGLSFIPVMLFAEKYNRMVVIVGTFCGCFATWVRLVSLDGGNYPLVLVSSVLIGFQSSVVCGTFVYIAERWFEPIQRTLATQLTLQGNYAGWALGAVVSPYEGGSFHSLRRLFYIQAITMTLSFIAVLIFYRSPPKLMEETVSVLRNDGAVDGHQCRSGSFNYYSAEEEESHHKNSNEKLKLPMTAMFSNPQFRVLFVCLSIMTGIGFTIPAVQQEQLASLHFSDVTIGWSSCLFISSGVIVGIILGNYLNTWEKCSQGMYWMFLVTSISLTLMFCLQYSSLHWVSLDHSLVLVVTLLCMFFAGGASLASLGVGMRVVVVITEPISDVYTASVIEFGVQCMSAALPLLSFNKSYGYANLAIISWFSTFLIVCLNQSPINASKGQMVGDYHSSPLPDLAVEHDFDDEAE